MSIRLDDKEREALRALNSAQMAPLLAYLKKEASETMGQLIIQPDEVQLRRLQGKAIFLHDLLGKVQALNA